jgi:hypothetical protein
LGFEQGVDKEVTKLSSQAPLAYFGQLYLQLLRISGHEVNDEAGSQQEGVRTGTFSDSLSGSMHREQML